jgi:hypothetical protein
MAICRQISAAMHDSSARGVADDRRVLIARLDRAEVKPTSHERGDFMNRLQVCSPSREELTRGGHE